MEKKDAPRDIVLKALANVEKGAHIQEALSFALDISNLDPAARRLCADLAYGCLREDLRLSFILGKILKNPHKLPKPMLDVLKIGVYSLVAQERAPQYAVVHGLVEQVKKKFGARLAGVANGALRSVQRLGGDVNNPAWYAEGSVPADAWKGACIFHSIPMPIANLWATSYGRENALLLMRRSSERPRTAMRINATHANAHALREEIRNLPEACAMGEWGFVFSPGQTPERILGAALEEWWKKGAFSWQAAGSMAVMHNLGLDEWKGPILDACAGFGGKSALLAEMGRNVSLAADVSAKRLHNLIRDFARLGLKIPNIIRADAARFPLTRWDGNILADVPCSGLGVLARRPELRGKFGSWSYEKAQRAILEGLSGQLPPGRELAYITCALNPAENEELIASFLANHPDMRLLRQWRTPHDHPWLEGMYGAVLGRN